MLIESIHFLPFFFLNNYFKADWSTPLIFYFLSFETMSSKWNHSSSSENGSPCIIIQARLDLPYTFSKVTWILWALIQQQYACIYIFLRSSMLLDTKPVTEHWFTVWQTCVCVGESGVVGQTKDGGGGTPSGKTSCGISWPKSCNNYANKFWICRL